MSSTNNQIDSKTLLILRFYRALSEQSNSSPTLVRAKCFHTLDAYVRLITLLVKHSGETQNTVTKVNLLNKVIIYLINFEFN